MKVFIFLLSLLPVAAYSNAVPKQVKQAYSIRDYEKAISLCHDLLKTGVPLSDPSVEKIFFKTETNLYLLDQYLEQSSQRKDDTFFELLYIFMEKASVSRNLRLGKKWGEVFLRDAGETKKYGKGLYLYSSLLLLQKEEERAKFVFDSIPKDKVLKKSDKLKVFLLALSTEKKYKWVIKKSKKFLREHYRSEYSDFVMAVLIHAYNLEGKEKRAEKFRKKFEEDFPNSPFREISQM